MFTKQGEYSPAGMYSVGHFILLFIFLAIAIAIFFLLKNVKKEKVITTLKVITIVITALELFKIIWNIAMYGFTTAGLNHYLPLYYCSLYIYALWGISFGKNKVQRASFAWLLWGGGIAGLAFLSYPSSSLIYYPAFHFLSIYSIMFHTFLVLTVILIVYHKIYSFKKDDFIYYLAFSLVFMIPALILNKLLNINMMFLEFPIAINILNKIYELSVPLFQIFFFVFQLFVPYFVTLAVVQLKPLLVKRNNNDKLR
ncbi:MAG TPA: hypothetical protein VFD05_04415 [Bacilli bacterium]|nr:hypothetical protein [Bacilli bacterium]